MLDMRKAPHLSIYVISYRIILYIYHLLKIQSVLAINARPTHLNCPASHRTALSSKSSSASSQEDPRQRP